MYTYNESSSEQDVSVVVTDSIADVSKAKANSLIDELKRQGIEIIATHAESDLDAVLDSCTGRCIVYLSPQSVSDVCKNSLLSFASRRGRDAVVVVVDDSLETPTEEWKDFLCLRYDNHRLKELCRELTVLIRTPLLRCRLQDNIMPITGYAAAFRVFNGYLRFVLPNFRKRLKELYTYASCVKKLLIICPASCYCPPVMTVEGSIEHADAYVLRNVTRAGQKHRDFSESVYRIRDEERKRDYYFAADFDNSLAGLRIIQKSGLAGIDDAHICRVRNNYILHLEQLLKHSDVAKKYTGQYRILYWRDHEVSLDKFLLSVVREELESDPGEVFETHIDFECVDGSGVNPGSLFSNTAECYKLDSEPKGICLIINIAEFDTSTDNDVPQNLLPRTGSEDDVCQLTAVFQWLKFQVQVHRNVPKSEFLRIIKETRERDHTAYDAFVCFIMSHGQLGHIFTADGQSVGILEDIAHAFYPESCPTLDGKPKMFFIQACQISSMHGDSVPVQGTAGEGEFSASETCTNEPDAETYAALEATKTSLLLPTDVSDFFISYSTLPGSLSYRDHDKGTFYIQELTEELKKGREVKASLDEVARRVQQKAPGQQTPFYYVSSVQKSVYLCGPRCKINEDQSFTDRSEADLMQRVENPTSESSVEDNAGNFLATANENSENGLVNDPGDKPNRSGGHGATAVAGVAPKLTDPFDFHVYVGFSPENETTIKRLRETLTTRWNLLCCNRQDTDTLKEQGGGEHLIACSEKCILYLTEQYMEEPWAKAEIDAAVKKARVFSGDMLFVLKDRKLPAESLKGHILQNFPACDWPPLADVDDDDALPHELVSWLRQKAELCPITQMPKKISGRYEALAYYFSYLILVLDNHRQKMNNLFDFGEKIVLPMLIVVPESCKAPNSFDIKGKILTCRPTSCSDKYVMTPSNRAGRKNRDYRISVMKLIVDAEKNDVIYFSGEFPAILSTLYETFQTGLTGLTEDQLDEIRDDFYSTLQSLLCHPDNNHCLDQYRLVRWSDNSVDLYDCLLPILCSAAEEGDASPLVVEGTGGGGRQLLDSDPSFSRLESSNDLKRLWDGHEPYVMRDDVSPRGICLIINISDVETPTSVIDVALLGELFSRQFDFDVRVHSEQMTSDQLDSLLCGVALEDHRSCDAFVCYIASRGRLGTVCTSDGKFMPAVNLVDIFSDRNSSTLRGKPKLFLVQTTDDGTTDDSVFDNNETQTPASSSSSGPPLMQDAVSSPPNVEDVREALAPRVADILISFACLSGMSASDVGETSVYVQALTEHLRPGVDVRETLNKVNKQFKDRLSQFSPGAEVVFTVNKHVVFPTPSPK